MSAKRHERTFARKCAVQALYTSEIQNLSPTEVLEHGLCLAEDGPLNDYAVTLIKGVEAHCQAIDDQLGSVSENWSVERMPIVDRIILRLAVFEMLHCEQVPVSVAINEAVELAKEFGGEDESPRFVNGVLGQIARTTEGAASEPSEGVEEAQPSPAEASDADATSAGQPVAPKGADAEEEEGA